MYSSRYYFLALFLITSTNAHHEHLGRDDLSKEDELRVKQVTRINYDLEKYESLSGGAGTSNAIPSINSYSFASANLDFEGKSFNSILSYKTLGFSLDYLIENSFLKIPNFIKIDIDGNEHLLLEGFKNNLSNSKILQILVEVNENYKEQFESVIKLMKKNNFNLTDKFKASILTDNQDSFSNTYNYIFKR